MFDPEAPPEFAVSRWLNGREASTLERSKGQVVVVLAFQMLCPGCVEHAIPQLKRLQARFNPDQVAFIGLHTVFEHHAAMPAEALEVFTSEFKLPFPVGIATPGPDGIPLSMAAYQMQGTPTLLIFDRAGRLRRHYFGRPDDILLAAEIMALAIEDKGSPRNEAALIERKLSATLVGDTHHANDHHGHHDHAGHHHEHGDACGCDHHHHGHDHDHAKGDPLAGLAEDVAARLRGSEQMTELPTDASKRR